MYSLIIVTAYQLLQISRTLNLTSKNVCPRHLQPVENVVRNISTDVLIMECCPNYIAKNGICEPCPAGTYGKSCEISCISGQFGKMCNSTCNCSSVQVCNNIFGCICPEGLTGNKCDKVCPDGKYGEDCDDNCNCSTCSTCDNATGNCLCDEQSIPLEQLTTKEYTSEKDHSSHFITVYVGMASALIVLVCIVAVIVRVQQKVYRFFSAGKRKCPNVKHKLRKIIPKKSDDHTHNESVEAVPNIFEAHAQPFLCELGDGYCEVSDVICVPNHTRHTGIDHIDITS
ncbi:uncharacterized protein [Mytilus edulis]|uniref:uncharacterized protein n=1 Tax=Mytilus edulis TaxID=6550 RepID=UPI0039F06FFF